MTETSNQHYTVEQVAEMWACSKSTVRNMIDRGELRAVKIGARMIRIPATSLEAATSAANPMCAGVTA